MNYNSGGIFLRPFIIALLIPLSGVFGQRPYSLSELTDSAIKNLPLLLEKKSLVNSRRSAVIDARHRFMPFLRANAQVDLGTDNSLPGSYFPFGIIPSTSAGVNSENNMQTAAGSMAILYGQYTVLDFGYRKATIQSALSDVDLQSADFERTKYQVSADIARLYFNLLKNQMQLDVEAQNRERYEKIFSVIHALAFSGIKPGADSSLARAELSKSVTEYNQVSGYVNDIREQLSYYTGIPFNLVMIDSIQLKTHNAYSVFFSDTTSASSNPLIAYYVNVNKVYASNENKLAKSFQPTFSLVASGWTRSSSITSADQYGSLGSGLGIQRYNYLAGVSFQYDLFNGIHKKDQLAITRFEEQAGIHQLEQEQLALQSAANQADLAIHTAELNLQELPVQIQSAQDTYNQKIAQYKAGLISLIDLTNAAFVLNRSQNDFAETITDWYLANLNKAVATGSLDRFIQTIK
jgi:outer membrane protein TolC